MAFLLKKNLEISETAQEKILADFRLSPHPTQIPVLLYVIKSSKKLGNGQVLSEKYDFFGWGAHWKSEVPEEAIWEIEGHTFAIQDGRWEPQDRLLLDVVGGHFCMNLHITGNGN